LLKVASAPAVLGMALLSTAAFAQAPQGAADADEEGEVVIVTGSRIASQVVDSNAPLQIVSSETIADSGATNIQELLLENPAFGTPTLSRTNSAFLTSGTGVATVDLRDLGSDRTLVLINGRRVVASLDGSSTVDLNVIPTQFLDRIDVLTGGASSLYGSDAIAGVVNFVYKRDFEGLSADGQVGITEEGDDIRYQTSLTAGANIADGRGNIMVHLGYSNEEGVLSRQRANTAVDDSDTSALSGDLADYGVPTEPFYSSYPEQGRFLVGGRTFTYSPAGQLQPCSTTNGATCSSALGTGVGPNGFNRQYYRTIAVPVERYLFSTVARYDVTDHVTAVMEATYNKTQSSRIIEPFALASDGSTGVYPASGRMPIENYIMRDTDNDGVAERILVANPLVPAAMAAVATDVDGDGLRDLGFARRISEFGTRSGSTTRDYFRFVVGLEGSLMDERFRWDLSYNFGQVTENQISNGQVNVVNFRDALAVQQDYDDLNGNGSTADFICISAEARANGCVPANIFGKGNISQAAVDYIQAQSSFQTKIQQQVVQGNISGSAFELPAGPLGVAVGFEYRRENSAADHDALTNQGLNAGNVLPDTFGSFDVVEGYAEVRVPILADKPFFNLLELGGAYRVADYSTVGSVSSYNVQATWEPIPEIRFRGTYARAVRAPNIGELFSGLSQTFPSGLQDPCEGIGASGGGAIGDNCRAAPGVSANIAANGVFTLSQGDRQGISGFNGGNANLNEETADSWTLGVIIKPRSIDALRNLTITADYYNIEIKDIIAGFGRGFTLERCYETGDPTFCDLITRRPADTSTNSAGSIEFIDDFQVNAAKIQTEGLDVTVNWFTPVNLFNLPGRITATGSYTHLFKYDYFPVEGAAPDAQDGEIGTAADRFTAKLGYSNDKMRLSFTGTFIGRSYEDDTSWCAFFDNGDPKCVSVPAEFYLDMQAGFTPSDKIEVYFGVDNLLDNAAPNILSNTTFNVTGTDTAADVYDVFGRRYYAGVRLRF
jgi:outer membrane receptor protein involved in Fe transport